MKYQLEEEPVYFHVLEGSPYLLADERCKKKLLDFVFDQYYYLGWRLYAFCVTDCSVYLLTVTAGHSFNEQYLEKIIELFLNWGTSNKELYLGDQVSFVVKYKKRLSDMDEVVNCCAQIHLVPVAIGVVGQPEDYWWSSYKTYLGEFDWQMVDCHGILFYFSLNSVLAKRRIRKFHENMELPV